MPQVIFSILFPCFHVTVTFKLSTNDQNDSLKLERVQMQKRLGGLVHLQQSKAVLKLLFSERPSYLRRGHKISLEGELVFCL